MAPIANSGQSGLRLHRGEVARRKAENVIGVIRLDATGEENDTSGLRVVVVDDHPSYAHGIAGLLRALGDIEVIGIAHDADVAVEMATRDQPDVVLMDIDLPERSGIDATRQITADCPQVKVAILTASNAPSDLREAMGAGARGYLLKQSDAGELVAGIKAIAAGETVVESSLARAAETARQEEPLTENEVRLLRLLSSGLELSAIGREMNMSPSTVKRHLVQVQRKLGADNRIAAVVAAARKGLL